MRNTAKELSDLTILINDAFLSRAMVSTVATIHDGLSLVTTVEENERATIVAESVVGKYLSEKLLKRLEVTNGVE